jgi:DNA repair protein RecO (recombination protein O)
LADIAVEGVVLRRWDSGESDRRIAILTREMGKIYAVARGARKANARLAGVSEPLMHAQFGIAQGRSANYITQAQPLAAFSRLRDDYSRLMCGVAFLEAVDAVLHVGEPHPEAFELCLVALPAIEEAREPLAPLTWADLRLMEIAGFGPEFSVSVESGKALRGSQVLLSPSAGGALLLGESELQDGRLVAREVAITLALVQELVEPPPYFKRARDVAKALLPFWVEVAGRDLPARRAILS